MRRAEAVVLAAAGTAMASAGLTWLFGPFGLLGAGVALVVAALIVDVKEG